jgi:polyhydroxyalkanoate synthesis regulator phasin
MSDTQSQGQAYDLFESWRVMRDAGMDAWAKAMVETVKNEDYARVTGTMLDAYLTASIPFREMVERTMAQALQQFNMPSRADITSLAERLTNIEMRLDDLDSKITQVLSRPAAHGTGRKGAAKRKKAR